MRAGATDRAANHFPSYDSKFKQGSEYLSAAEAEAKAKTNRGGDRRRRKARRRAGPDEDEEGGSAGGAGASTSQAAGSIFDELEAAGDAAGSNGKTDRCDASLWWPLHCSATLVDCSAMHVLLVSPIGFTFWSTFRSPRW